MSRPEACQNKLQDKTMKNHQHDCVYYFENEQQIQQVAISFKSIFQIKLTSTGNIKLSIIIHTKLVWFGRVADYIKVIIKDQ